MPVSNLPPSTPVFGDPVPLPQIRGLEKQPSIRVLVLTYDELSHAHTGWLLESAPWIPRPAAAPATPGRAKAKGDVRSLGLDTEFDGPFLGLIQLASETRCLLIKVPKPTKGSSKTCSERNQALDSLLTDPFIRKTGCELTKDALLLRSNFGHDLRGGVDLTHLYSPSKLDATARSTKGLFTLFSEMYLPHDQPLLKDKMTTTSRWVGVQLTRDQLLYGILDAWVSYKVGVHDFAKVAKAPVLDFATVKPLVLTVMMEHNSATLAVENMTRKQYDSKFSTVILRKDGSYDVLNTQFRNKLMFHDKVVMHLASGKLHLGTVKLGPYGKTKMVKLDQPLNKTCRVDRITVVEQGGARGADEFLRDVFPKLVLHGLLDTSTIPLFALIFLRKKGVRNDSSRPDDACQAAPNAPAYDLSGHKLNPSQTKAVQIMLNTPKPVNLIHGPPGTGKTYAITAAVATSVTSGRNDDFYVLTCQTNAATRNLAVTLLKRQVTDFKIVVSDNFFVEWHEEQYKVIRDHVVQSSETKAINFDKLIGPRTVVLCSLSQLSNPSLVSVFRQRRVTHLVIDEASQICLANLPHVLALYRDSLQRVTFVGDPMQLAPFGNEQHPTVQSIFEQLPTDIMLKQQYRMPHDLGMFISTHVYNGQLTSHKSPRPECSVALIDVSDGVERLLGTGINNLREADAVVKVIINQFLGREFLVITPYNAQKELIANRLRDAIRTLRSQGQTDIKLALADERVHTVDTVQGQEADVIVFSAVRTIQPGFLSNKRRMNVALTRAKDRLIIVAHMALFRTGHGRKSLLGAFVREMENIIPVVNSKLLAPGFKLDFTRKPILTSPAVQAKRNSPTTSRQRGTGMTHQTVSSKRQGSKLNALSVAVGCATEPKAKGKHWKKNQKRNAKKKEEKTKRKTGASSASSFTGPAR
ncbi:hypothetical protein HDU88_008726 [Geranomyces variabilis]|nr:hypothetical protein HDU88_008726 [Geranomyces variabilis]